MVWLWLLVPILVMVAAGAIWRLSNNLDQAGRELRDALRRLDEVDAEARQVGQDAGGARRHLRSLRQR